MYPASFIQELKQSNISADGEKTKERFKAVWKSASNEDKNAIIAAVGVIPNTIYRVYNTGSISAKILVPCVQTLNIDPLYLIGEADEKGECSEDALRGLLERLGYEKKLAALDKEAVKKPRKPRKAKSVAADTEPACDVGCENADVDDVEPETEEQTEQRFDEEMKAALLECVEEYCAENEVTPPSFLRLLDVDADKLTGLSEDDLIMLLRTLLIRAQIGVPDAVEKAALLKRLLLS